MTLFTKYFPADVINLKATKNGFTLNDNSINLIARTSESLEKASKLGHKVPESSANILKYGLVLEEIFNNQKAYQKITYLKGRSRRGHLKEIAVNDYDLNKIELELKKSKLPFKLKTLNDDKFIKNKKKEYLVNLKNNDFENILADAKIQIEYFVLENSIGFSFFNKTIKLITELNKEREEKHSLENIIKNYQTQLKELEAKKNDFLTKINDINAKINDIRQELGYFNLLEEKDALINDPDLALFLKIISSGIERYVRRVELKESIELPEREILMDIAKDPSRTDQLTKESWKIVINIFEKYGTDLLGNKNWFIFTDNSELRTFLTKDSLLKQYARLRNIEQEILMINQKIDKLPERKLLEEINKELEKLHELPQILQQEKEKLTDVESTLTTIIEELNKLFQK